MSLLIAIPTLSLVTDKWAVCLAQMQYPIAIQGEIHFFRGKGTVGEKRNKAVKYALDNGFDRILFLDDDVIMPPNAIRKMWLHDKEIISGVYYTKREESMPIVIEKEGGGAWVNYPKDKIFEAWGHPMGCSLIKTSVFKDMNYPYFHTPDDNSQLKRGTEEHLFWKQCDSLGIRRFIDPTIQCGHIDKTDFDDAGNPALYIMGKKTYKEGGEQ